MTDLRPLTIGERIVVHLSQFLRHQDEYVVPPGMAQSGIAESLGISRAHTAIELRRAMDAGRVEVRIAHVTGAPTRRKVYRLTPKGERVLGELALHHHEELRSAAPSLVAALQRVMPEKEAKSPQGPKPGSSAERLRHD